MEKGGTTTEDGSNTPGELFKRRAGTAACESRPFSRPYSPKCVEGRFCEVELPLDGALGSTRRRVALQVARVDHVPKRTTVLERLPVRAGRGPEPRPVEGGHPRARGASGATGCRNS